VYSGQITEVGRVVERDAGLTVSAPGTARELRPGGSVNVNGVCLSAAEVGEDTFRADVSAETARRSTLASLGESDYVNLELPLTVGDRLNGHLVQGHVDAVGKVARVDAEASGVRVWIRPPRRFLDGVIAKSSVAVDGISLTVAELLPDRFSVALIPVTQRTRPLGASRWVIGSTWRPICLSRQPGSCRRAPGWRRAGPWRHSPGRASCGAPQACRSARRSLRPVVLSLSMTRIARPRRMSCMPVLGCGLSRWCSCSPRRAATPPCHATARGWSGWRSRRCRDRGIVTAPRTTCRWISRPGPVPASPPMIVRPRSVGWRRLTLGLRTSCALDTSSRYLVVRAVCASVKDTPRRRWRSAK
jgi:riboflavin synthase alpha subunit